MEGENLRSIIEQLKEKQNELMGYRIEAINYLKSTVEGRLRIDYRKGKPVYYLDRDNKEEYIPAKEKKIAYQLAQQGYYEKVLKYTEKELKNIDKFLKTYKDDEIYQIYSRMSEPRKKLVDPLVLLDEDYVYRWKNNLQSIKNSIPIQGEIYTELGEHVRSKSEKMIADKFVLLDVPYKYEDGLRLDNGQLVYPDFKLLDIANRREILYEHFGMMDDAQYAENAIKKISMYQNNGYRVGDNFLFSFETQKNPLNIRLVEQTIRNLLNK